MKRLKGGNLFSFVLIFKFRTLVSELGTAKKNLLEENNADWDACLVDGLGVEALIRLLVEGGAAIPIAAEELVGAQSGGCAVEAVHILLVALRAVLAEILL